ncbi:MAG: hypothetical protein LUH05_09570 [Candidatus Gastranaerophilales bacterium]|nr:hypothetical protein [Candidatus Gastranaerophilales bacterium]
MQPYTNTGVLGTIKRVKVKKEEIMEEHGLNFADFIVNQVCPDNKFLEEMVIPWQEIEAWFKKI